MESAPVGAGGGPSCRDSRAPGRVSSSGTRRPTGSDHTDGRKRRRTAIGAEPPRRVIAARAVSAAAARRDQLITVRRRRRRRAGHLARRAPLQARILASILAGRTVQDGDNGQGEVGAAAASPGPPMAAQYSRTSRTISGDIAVVVLLENDAYDGPCSAYLMAGRRIMGRTPFFEGGCISRDTWGYSQFRAINLALRGFVAAEEAESYPHRSAHFAFRK